MLKIRLFSIKTLLMLTTLAALTFSSCKDEEEPETELITTVGVLLSGPGFNQSFYWNDLDGDGGNAPTIDTIRIPALTGNIECRLDILDRSASPEVDIATEILAESDAHVFTYAASNLDGLMIGDFDLDGNGAPLRFNSVWETGQPRNGTLTITLYHEPTDKSNAANPGGEVDFQVTFPVVIE